MSRETTSIWRLRARRYIRDALAGLPADAPRSAVRRALREAYPRSWPRSGWVYQCWLTERRAALGAEKESGPARVDWIVGPAPSFFIRVDCVWCDNKNLGSGCLVCGPLWERLHGELSADADLMALLRAVREAPEDRLRRLVVADYLEERGLDRLAELFRATCEGESHGTQAVGREGGRAVSGPP